MAHVQKRMRSDGKPVYLVKYRTPDGRSRTKGGFVTRKSAEAYANTVNFNTARGAVFDPRSGMVHFRVAAGDWLASRHDLKERTRAEYAHALAPRKRRSATASWGIDETWGAFPINKMTRAGISEWVHALTRAGAKPSTVRNQFFLVRMVLAQAVVDGRLATNPADYVTLPSERLTDGGAAGVVDDPTQFLTARQVGALVDATPWPYCVMVHLAAWSGLRAAELGGLQLGDIDLPPCSGKPGTLRVERTSIVVDGRTVYDTPKTRGSRRRVPLTQDAVTLLRTYLELHPRKDDAVAPLFPAFGLVGQKPTGLRATDHEGKRLIPTASEALAGLSTSDAERRLSLNWTNPVRHTNFYSTVYRPAVIRANRLTPGAELPRNLRFHALRHTYASLCVSAGIPALAIAKFMGHSKVTTTLTIYAHLFEDDHSAAMNALGALSEPG